MSSHCHQQNSPLSCRWCAVVGTHWPASNQRLGFAAPAHDDGDGDNCDETTLVDQGSADLFILIMMMTMVTKLVVKVVSMMIMTMIKYSWWESNQR